MTPNPDPSKFTLRRRDLLRGGAGLGALSLGAPALAAAQGEEQDSSLDFMAGGCTLTPSDVQGPFWLNLALLRQDITEGTVGYPLSIYIKLIDANTCAPINGGVVDLWHDDPDGRYSGFASEGTAGSSALRGIQITGMDGLVRFDTVYPGWYTGRTPHVHLKINPNAGSELTTQVYFEDEVSRRVYLTPPYDTRGPSPVTNDTDAFFDSQLLAGVRPRRGVGTRLLAGKVIAIQ